MDIESLIWSIVLQNQDEDIFLQTMTSSKTQTMFSWMKKPRNHGGNGKKSKRFWKAIREKNWQLLLDRRQAICVIQRGNRKYFWEVGVGIVAGSCGVPGRLGRVSRPSALINWRSGDHTAHQSVSLVMNVLRGKVSAGDWLQPAASFC